MGDPELHGDEKILLTTQNVFVKSIPFEAVLTNKRIILIDRKKNLIPPKDILLATIRDIEAEENAIRDPVISLSLITSTGETRQLVLTFSRTAGGGRKRERDQWMKALKDQASSSIQRAIRKIVPSFDQDTVSKPREKVTPKIEIANRPAAKKEIEGAQPIKKIIETGNVPPKPVETTSLPAGSFCNRCGNRVPPESLFCNRCGTKVGEPESREEESAVPQVPVDAPALPVTVPAAERKERPIDREIQSIEPLIEGSVPRSAEAPPVSPPKPAETPAESPAVPESPIAKAAQSIIDAVKTPPGPASAPVPAGEALRTQEEGPAQPVLPESPPVKDLPAQPAAGGAPPSPAPPAEGAGAGRRSLVMVAIAAIIIIALAGGGFLYWNSLRSDDGGAADGSGGSVDRTPTTVPPVTKTPTPLPTTIPPVTTTPATPEETQVPIPRQGVWIRVTYPNTFRGTLGTAADQQPVSDSGDKFYSIPTSEGIVQAAIQKADGSGEELVVEIYKNGSLVTRRATTVPRGVVEVQADLKPPETTTLPTTAIPATIPTSTGAAAANTTATPQPA